jgi:hypothetical protein
MNLLCFLAKKYCFKNQLSNRCYTVQLKFNQTIS